MVADEACGEVDGSVRETLQRRQQARRDRTSRPPGAGLPQDARNRAADPGGRGGPDGGGLVESVKGAGPSAPRGGGGVARLVTPERRWSRPVEGRGPVPTGAEELSRGLGWLLVCTCLLAGVVVVIALA